MCINSKLYYVPINVQGEQKYIPCYGLGEIATAIKPPEEKSYTKMCTKFRISPSEARRHKKIDLLISMIQQKLFPDKKVSIEHISLCKGSLGKVFGGNDSDLDFTLREKLFLATI